MARQIYINDLSPQENCESDSYCLLKARRSCDSAAHEAEVVAAEKRQKGRSKKLKGACQIGVTVCMDESQKLQGRFVSKNKRTESLSKNGSAKVADSFSNYFSGTDDSRILDEQRDIMDALHFGLRRNNLLIDLQFDDVSMLLPNKHVYELIYNRLGNDMLLWMPAIFRGKY